MPTRRRASSSGKATPTTASTPAAEGDEAGGPEAGPGDATAPIAPERSLEATAPPLSEGGGDDGAGDFARHAPPEETSKLVCDATCAQHDYRPRAAGDAACRGEPRSSARRTSQRWEDCPQAWGGRLPPSRPAPSQEACDVMNDRLTGVVSRWLPQHEVGYIQSRHFEGLVGYRFRRVMLEFQDDPPVEGDEVEFNIQLDARGRACATAVKPILGWRPADCIGQRLCGYVRRFANRCGFLSTASFDGDLLVHQESVLQSPEGPVMLHTGQPVEFDVAADHQGRIVAARVSVRSMWRLSDRVGHRCRGYVRSLQGAHGIINSSSFDGDLHVHRDALLAPHQGGQFVPGAVVEFDIAMDNSMREESIVARRVCVLERQQHEAQPPPYGAEFSGPPPLAGDRCVAAYPPYCGQQLPQPLAAEGWPCPLVYAAPMATGMAYGYGMPQSASDGPPHPAMYGTAPPQMPQGLPLVSIEGRKCPIGGDREAGAASPQLQQQPTAPDSAAQSSEMPQIKGHLDPGAAVDESFALECASEGGSIRDIDSDASGQAASKHLSTKKGLFIVLEDWAAEQTGQLSVTEGSLVRISQTVAHGWVWGGIVRPTAKRCPPLHEGWLPEALLRKVRLHRATMDWTGEEDSTLSVSKGEVVAVSKEAARGWVFAERVGTRDQSSVNEGWLPREILNTFEGS